MKQQSFAILLPCQVDMFAGVEFVCCPRDDAPEPESRDEVDGKQSEDFLDNYQLGDAQEEEEEEDIEDVPSTEEPDMQDEQTEDDTWDDEYYDDEYDEDDWSDEEDDYDDDWSDEDWDDEEEEEDAPEEVSTSTVASPAATDEAPQVTDVYTQYLRSGQENGNEHTYFSMAKSELQKHHHEKVTKMMKEWAAARQRVQEMKATDPKAADKLNREITARFQKTYQALEQEGAAEKKQLVALHQQRVQADLNEKKRHAMEHYMTALQKPTPDGQAIAKALKHYIKAEEKDRLHSINHYKHLRDTDPVEADRIRQQTLSHLAIIDQRIEQSREMLNRVPELAQNIQLQIEDFLTQFRELDTNIASLLVQTEERAEAVQPAAVLPTNEEQPDTDAPEPMETATPSPAVAAVSTDEDTAFRAPIEQQPAFKPTRYDDEVMEDERAYVEIKQAHVARHSVNSLSLSETSKYRMDNAHGVHTGSALGLAVGCIAVFIVIVVGIVVLKRKVTRRPVNHGFVEVDAASPEERHVANMQINGYENPTYKYFEMGQSKA